MENLSNFELGADPLASFVNWHSKAQIVELNADAMSLATYDSEKKRPSARYLLYKGLKDNKIVFYTNYFSPKSHDLELNPEVALSFYWHNSKKQVRIQGRVERMNLADSKKYFHSRDRDSQIASFISHQSAIIEDKQALLSKFEEVKNKYANTEIPHPENWGGYLVTPYEFEFFLYGDFRLNDRFLYTKGSNGWSVNRLQP
jgi:pyridoxamine 5'-phosphate oxidase